MPTPLPEWAPHERVWIGFPAIRDEWGDAFDDARVQIAAFARAVADDGRGETVNLVCNTADDAQIAANLAGPTVETIVEPIGDVWLRDTAPIVTGHGTTRRAADFAFNGWGGKYLMPGDSDIGARLAARRSFARDAHAMILEGGGIDWDGTGLCVTTEQCLLNPNRNPGMDRHDIERVLADALGFARILWLGDGLVNDHTDGHVDNLARWVGPGRLLLPQASGDDDPNAAIYADALHRAQTFGGIDIDTIPSPGRVVAGGEAIPASYMNFYIGNSVVVMPAYGVTHDDDAAERLAELFPTRRIVALPSNAILAGGGSFHCTSQQVPA
ncbi:MAG: agmatine deiminase family protein [Sphingopyxis sp.]|nr:agmatine deiminase family protein [Sphingopyxis sp.]